MSAGKKTVRILGFILVGVALLALYFGTVVWLGVRNGEAERDERQIATLRADVAINYALAQESVADGNYVLAERAIERVLTEIPYVSDSNVSQADANRLYAEIVGQQAAIPEITATPKQLPPTRAATITPTPATAVEKAESTPAASGTTTPLPTAQAAEPVDEKELNDQISQIEQLLAERQFEIAIEELVAFQILNPNYERYRTDSLLFDAYVNAGYKLTVGNEVSRGVNYFELAQRLGTLPEAATTQLQISQVYLQGLAYRGIRWPVAISNFAELCSYASEFHDPCQLLYDSYLAYGRQLAESENICLAAEQYQAAYDLAPSDGLNETLSKARFSCGSATPTPLPEGPWTPTPAETATTEAGNG